MAKTKRSPTKIKKILKKRGYKKGIPPIIGGIGEKGGASIY